MPTPFVSKRAPIYADVPDEKWNDWRWQLSHRLNTAEEFEKIIPLTESELSWCAERSAQRVQCVNSGPPAPYTGSRSGRATRAMASEWRSMFDTGALHRSGCC